jgi:hypothetical protein
VSTREVTEPLHIYRGEAGPSSGHDRAWPGTLTGSSQTWRDLAAAAASGGHQNNPILVEGDGTGDLTIYQVELKDSPMYHASRSRMVPV